MLVLSRKVGERILIGDQVAVTIVRVSGGGVRVGIEAPAEMAVLRAEILDEQNGEKPSSVEMFKASSAKASASNSPEADNSNTKKSASLPSLEEKPLRKAR